MPLNAHEQYILELINRGRLDPLGEAARFGIDLNDGLAAGTISTGVKQVVAANELLNDAAEAHSLWMMQANTFSHTGQGGSSALDRMRAAGYEFTGPYQTYGENLAYGGSTGGIDINEQAEIRYNNLFLSAGHRANTLKDGFREVGIAHEEGMYNQYHASMLTENFATSGTEYFITGVAYTDTNGNNFYNIGEGRSDITFVANGTSATVAAAGGYGIGIDPDSSADVTIRQGGTTLASLSLDVGSQNAKLDLLRDTNAWELAVSADVDLGSGIAHARALGVASLDLTGHGGNNRLTGNVAANTLNGQGGNDTLYGLQGNDVLIDGDGQDVLVGGNGADLFILSGDGLSDTIRDWGKGADQLDLQAWSGVASLQDLTVTTTATGAILISESEELVLLSNSGGSITLSQLQNTTITFGNLPSAVAVAPAPIEAPEVPELAPDPASGATVLSGSAGADSMAGSAGNDLIMGEDGRDILGGSGGADTLYGGNGNDRYILNSATDAIGGEVGYSQGGGIDTVWAYVDYVLPRNIEILRLQGEADLSAGGNYAPEALVGNAGNNQIDAGGGNDKLVGKEGNDTLIGRAGADTLQGNEGEDVFLFTAASDSRAGAANRDFINGFERGSDKIDLTHVDADTLRGGHQSFDFIGNVAFSGTGASSAGELRYFTFSGGNFNIVEADTDGDGTADMQIFINLTHWMTGTDFIL